MPGGTDDSENSLTYQIAYDGVFLCFEQRPDEEAVVDQGGTSSVLNIHYEKEELEGHRTLFVGVRMPLSRQTHRHHRPHSSRCRKRDRTRGSIPQDEGPTAAPNETDMKTNDTPSQRVQFILGKEEDEEHVAHDLFTELDEICVKQGKDAEWKETARWLKFEEDVEDGGERWSKPYVATLSLHSLFELRSCIINGSVMLDVKASCIEEIADMVLDQQEAAQEMDESVRVRVREALLKRHHHQNEKKRNNLIPMVRSLADTSRKQSEPHIDKSEASNVLVGELDFLERPIVAFIRLSPAVLLSGLTEVPIPTRYPILSLMPTRYPVLSLMPIRYPILSLMPTRYPTLSLMPTRYPILSYAHQVPHSLKCPPGTPFFLMPTRYPILSLMPTRTPFFLMPTRFLFILLGQDGKAQQYHEIGRSMATIMTDEIFHGVAYKAKDRSDLLAGIDEFLDQVTVLPPGEWDPSIRIEPPKSVPSQEKRKLPGMPNGLSCQVEAEVHAEQHGPELQRTGRSACSTRQPRAAEDRQVRQPLSHQCMLNTMAPSCRGPAGKLPSRTEVHAGHYSPELQRTGRLFGGLVLDIKRKVPFYLSDFRDGLSLQCVASFLFLYCACMSPSAIESLLGASLTGVAYSLFAGQPLTILGSTGPVLVFEKILFKFCKDYNLSYLSLRTCIGLWTAFLCLLLVATDASALVCYITRFTEEAFASLICLIFIYEALEKLLHLGELYPINAHSNLDELTLYYCRCAEPDSPSNRTLELWSQRNISAASAVPWTNLTVK
ncbi:hypothetical protein JZ751_027244, partial [Albula glossodonta]